MTSPDAHAGPLGLRGFRDRAALLPRILAVVRAPSLDAELAVGVRPATSVAHRLRADRLRDPRVRRRIASALARAAEEAGHPLPRGTMQVALNHEAIAGCRRELAALAQAVAAGDAARIQGLAIAFRLAFDGGGPLFHQSSREGRERLANTVRAALAALRVSSHFDQLGV